MTKTKQRKTTSCAPQFHGNINDHFKGESLLFFSVILHCSHCMSVSFSKLCRICNACSMLHANVVTIRDKLECLNINLIRRCYFTRINGWPRKHLYFYYSKPWRISQHFFCVTLSHNIQIYSRWRLELWTKIKKNLCIQ